MGSENWALILSRSPILTLSWSPSRYQLAHISITSSSTRPRSSGVNMPPERGDHSDPLIPWGTSAVSSMEEEVGVMFPT